MRIGGLAIACGLALFLSGLLVPAYWPAEEWKREYAQLELGQSAEFYELRSEYVTVAYNLQDYGICLTLLGLVLLIFRKAGLSILVSPPSRLLVIVAAVIAALSFPVAFTVDLIVAVQRTEYPHWADSIGIPIVIVPVLLGVCVVWATAHLFLLCGNWRGGRKLRHSVRQTSAWLPLVQAVVTSLLVLIALYDGVWQYGTSFASWAVLFAWLAAGRADARDTAPNAS